MSEYVEQKSAIKFCLWNEILVAETFRMLQKVFGDLTMSQKNVYTRSVRKVSGLPLYPRVIVFERPLRGMNVNSKASRTYRLLADICRTCLCFVIVKND